MQIAVFYVLINSAFVGGNNLYLSKRTVEQQFKKSSLPFSQEPAPCTYSERAQSIPRSRPISCLKANFNVTLPLRLGFPSGFFPFNFPTEFLYTPNPCLIRSTFYAHLILRYSAMFMLHKNFGMK
jgi:hypothetical protein